MHKIQVRFLQNVCIHGSVCTYAYVSIYLCMSAHIEKDADRESALWET